MKKALPIISLGVFLFFVGWFINDVIIGITEFNDPRVISRHNDSLIKIYNIQKQADDINNVDDIFLKENIVNIFEAYSTIRTEHLLPFEVQFVDEYKIELHGYDSDSKLVEINISKKSFVTVLHALSYTMPTDSTERELLLIEDMIYYGVKNKVPNYKYNEIKITVNGEGIPLDETIYENLFEPNFINNSGKRKLTNAYFIKNTDYMLICFKNGTKNNHYNAALIFKDYKFIGRVVIEKEPLQQAQPPI